MISPKGVKLSCALCFSFKPTNNQAKYEALLASLRISKKSICSALDNIQ